MLYNSKNLYLIKVKEIVKDGLLMAGLLKDDKYYIAKKVANDKFIILRKELIVYSRKLDKSELNIGQGQHVVVTKQHSFIDIFSNPKKFYEKGELIDIENDIYEFQKDFEESKYINGEKTHLAK